MNSLKNKIITAITAVYLLATPAGVASSTRVDDGNSLENKTELVYSGESILRNTLNLNGGGIDSSIAPSTKVVDVDQSKPENMNNKVKFIVKYKSNVTGLEETIESTIKKPTLPKACSERGFFGVDYPDVSNSSYRDFKYREKNISVDATIIDGKDTLVMHYLVHRSNVEKSEGIGGSVVDLYTIKNGKTKVVRYSQLDYAGRKGSNMFLVYYDRDIKNANELKELESVVSVIDLKTKEKEEIIHDAKSKDYSKLSTVTDDFVDAQKLEFGVGLYYMYEINNRIIIRDSIRKQELEKKEQDKSKELYDKQKSTMQENSMW